MECKTRPFNVIIYRTDIGVVLYLSMTRKDKLEKLFAHEQNKTVHFLC